MCKILLNTGLLENCGLQTPIPPGGEVNHMWLVAYGVSLLTLTPTLFVESSTGMVDISLTLYIDKIAMDN